MESPSKNMNRTLKKNLISSDRGSELVLQTNPVKRVEIPKPNGKGTRNLGIPIVKDRVLHMAIKLVIEPILEPTFSKNQLRISSWKKPTTGRSGS